MSIESWARFQGFANVDNSLKILSEFFFTVTNSSTVTQHPNPAQNSEIMKKKVFSTTGSSFNDRKKRG